jgi:hypothetical protein
MILAIVLRTCMKGGVCYVAVIATVVARDSVVGRAASYQLDGMGLNPSESKIFGTRPNWPGAHPASCTMQCVSSLFLGGQEVEALRRPRSPI